jgi:phage baseplate assembly protein W
MATIGFTIPFVRSTGSLGLFYATSTTLAAAKEDLRSLLLTNWGERPMHFNLGCNLKEFLFSQMREGETDVLIEERIRSQVSKWLPFLAINQILVSFPTEHAVNVNMSFYMISNPSSVDNITVEVSA